MTIAGHTFDGHGRCSCGRTWADIRNTVEEEVENLGIAHSGKLSRYEYTEIKTARDAEDARIADAMKSVAAGASW